ncbi:hypothetical protein CRE_19511 [Caenorhabditis remanei]|uniref:F-box domain-containing protein n=1 Tax=Caenorhabditis remanei TaxID=31234 RepID=E3NI03_CAERE|nr:hypothetical protein CRE_19511 [Caenorhabditis remanei]
MKPLKELPILRLPFRAMEEVSKGMHSIIKMISDRRKKKFPILCLPFLAIEEIFKTMDPIEIINLSMTSKRAKAFTKNMTFYSKYSVQLCVDKTMGIAINGTDNLVSCLYLMTSYKQKLEKTAEDERDGFILRKVFKYSKDPVDEWKQLCKYVMEIFNRQAIDVLTVFIDVFVDQYFAIIDFLKTNVKSVNDCNVYQWEDENDVDEQAAYLLENITVTNELNFHLRIKNDNFDGKIPKNLRELFIKHAEWIEYEKLLETDSVQVIIGTHRISNNEWNLFFKKWIAMETHLNLELLAFDFKLIEEFKELVLYDIPHEVVDEGVKRTLITYREEKTEINGGIDIRRIDGKTATFIAHSNSFSMSVH